VRHIRRVLQSRQSETRSRERSAHRSRQRVVALLTLIGACFVPAPTGAQADKKPSGGMVVDAGSQQVTLASSRTLPDGRLQNGWAVGAAHVMVTAPPGTTVTIGQGTMEILPPLALDGAATAARAARFGHRAKGHPIAHAAWTNPCNHCWYNSLSGTYCLETCVYAGSVQYALQEVPGEWYVAQHISGTVTSGAGPARLGGAYNRFVNESGDSGPLNYKPGGDDCTSSSTSWNWSFSAFGLSFGENGPLSGGSCYGPIAPDGWGNPAFGSKWWANYEDGNHAIGSADAIHLGPGQNPYASLGLEAAIE
jgi:hypothetical protein